MVQLIDHVLKIQLEHGAFRSRLIRALEGMGGSARVMKPSVASLHTNENLDKAIDWIEIGNIQHAQDSSRMVKQWVLNAGLSVYTRTSSRILRQKLVIAGIPHTSQMNRPNHTNTTLLYQRRFKVSIFHLKALFAVPLKQTGVAASFHGEQPARDTKLWKRLERTAVRALYTLGLDIGEVVILAGEDGVFIIEEIHVTPDIREEAIVKLYAQAIHGLLEEMKQFSIDPSPILIGMDPEFLLFDRTKHKVVPASRFLKRQGEAGCDVLRYRGRRLFPLAELRPTPGREPREVVLHLLHAFKSAQQAIPENGLLWQAGGMPQHGFPLGGHLHFSGIPLTAELLRVMDNYLALPVAILEDARSFRRRPLYGFLGDYRLQDHGGFEYRTLPSFLVSTLVTKGVVAIARLIVEDGEELTLRPLRHVKIQEAFYKGDHQILREQLPPLMSDITSATSYPRYENYIAPFISALLDGKTWDESVDIRRIWKM